MRRGCKLPCEAESCQAVGGSEIGAFIVEKHLARFLEGQRVTDIEKMWDRMYFATLYYGRKGVVINAISRVDLALWDLLAKVRQEPVHQLLGGPVRLPYPAAPKQGSIYENQRDLANRFFKDAEETAAAAI